MPELRDSMEPTDQHIEVSLRCARCNAAVQSGAVHDCHKEDSNDGTRTD